MRQPRTANPRDLVGKRAVIRRALLTSLGKIGPGFRCRVVEHKNGWFTLESESGDRAFRTRREAFEIL